MTSQGDCENGKMSSYMKSFFDCLQKLRNESMYCDVIIEVGGSKRTCHQLVLAASCEYLHSVMRSCEANPGHFVKIKFPDCFHVEEVDILLNLFYTGQLNINDKNVKVVLTLASYLQLSSVRLQCLSLIKEETGKPHVDDPPVELPAPIVINDVTSISPPRKKRISNKNHFFDEFVYENNSLKRRSELKINNNNTGLESAKKSRHSVDGSKGVSDFNNLTKVASDAYVNLETKNICGLPQKTDAAQSFDEKTNFRCTSCSLLFTAKSALEAHISLKHKQKKHGCSFCGKSFDRKSDAELHERRKHMDVKPFGCNECSKTFALKRDLLIHKRIHKDGYAFKCCTCGKTFISSKGYSHHTTHAHQTKTMLCRCDAAFSSSNELEQHKLTCQVCESSSEEKRYQCAECGETFRWPHLLRRHHNSVHLKLKPFKCDECGRSFNREEHLRQHAASHTGKRDYKCDQCDKTFRQKAGLYVHKKTHSADQKVVCDICGYHCHSNSVLREHQLTHSTTRPYACSKCDKSFKALRVLKRHTKVHDKLNNKKKVKSKPTKKTKSSLLAKTNSSIAPSIGTLNPPVFCSAPAFSSTTLHPVDSSAMHPNRYSAPDYVILTTANLSVETASPMQLRESIGIDAYLEQSQSTLDNFLPITNDLTSDQHSSSEFLKTVVFNQDDSPAAQ